MTRTQHLEHMSTQCHKLARLAKRYPERRFVALNHYLTLDLLYEAYRRTRKSAAPGIDGQTAVDYEQALEANLRKLLQRAHEGCYQAPAVRRVYIPKGQGQHRPIGIPTFEDKVLQRAVVMILESIYEQDFCDSSYGFRPARSAHQALAALYPQLYRHAHIIELDIQSFFNELDKARLRAIVRRRIGDGVICRLIDKWLKAGVMEEGRLHYPDKGTPQGGVISPILANIYLHEVLDEWFERQVKPRLRGKGFLIRYADDALLGFSNERDGVRVMDALPKRFQRYGLKLHPQKTQQLTFTPGTGDTFDFLGFTHYWGKSRKGRWCIKRKTAKARFRRALSAVKQWCQRNRHQPVEVQYPMLCRKLNGHYAYYGISGNLKALSGFRFRVERLWMKWLGRRSQRARITWSVGDKLLSHYVLPKAHIVHRYA